LPVKRRIDKHGTLTAHRREALLYGPEYVLLAGVGYLERFTEHAAVFDRLPEPQRALVIEDMRADWHRFGASLLAQWTGPGKPWALLNFGDLSCL